MAIVYEKFVVEDLHLGRGAVTVTSPAGGTQTGTKISVGAFMRPVNTAYADPLTIDLAAGDLHTITLTGDVSATTISDSAGTPSKGDQLFLELVQDGTGGHTFNWPTDVLNGGTYILDTTANYRSFFWLLYNGANWIILLNAVTTS